MIIFKRLICAIILMLVFARCNDTLNDKSDIAYPPESTLSSEEEEEAIRRSRGITIPVKTEPKNMELVPDKIDEEIQCSKLVDQFEDYVAKYQLESIRLNEELDASTSMRQASYYQAAKATMQSLDKGGQNSHGIQCWRHYLDIKRDFILMCAQNGERYEVTQWDMDELQHQIDNIEH